MCTNPGSPLQDRRGDPGRGGGHHPRRQGALDAIRPAGVSGDEKVFGLSESQIARRVKVIAKAAGLADWEFFSGHSGRVGMARCMAQNGAPSHEIERQGRWKQGAAAWSAAIPAASRLGQRCGICRGSPPISD